MATRNYQGVKYEDRDSRRVNDALTVEEALQININGQPFTVTMRTPGDDEALIRGLLHAEDITDPTASKPDIKCDVTPEDGVVHLAEVTIDEDQLGPGYSNSRTLLSVSSCGICGKTELKDLEVQGERITTEPVIDVGLIPKLFDHMHSGQQHFRQSGGTHAASAFTIDGELLHTMEDIGRHNAVDKVVGKLLLEDTLSRAKILTVSGRISYEITIKCFKAGIPFLAAVSAPSSLAVDFAKELGITLFAFSRQDRTTCYAHPERTNLSILNNNKAEEHVK